MCEFAHMRDDEFYKNDKFFHSFNRFLVIRLISNFNVIESDV